MSGVETGPTTRENVWYIRVALIAATIATLGIVDVAFEDRGGIPGLAADGVAGLVDIAQDVERGLEDLRRPHNLMD